VTAEAVSSDALEVVRDAAERKRRLEADLRAARDAYADALREALKSNTRDQVAEAAGTCFQAVYETLARRDGKRRTIKPAVIQRLPVPIDY
jgi:hypothetical protein